MSADTLMNTDPEVLSLVENSHAGMARGFARATAGAVRWPEDADPMIYDEGRWEASRTRLDRMVADFCEATLHAKQYDDKPPFWLRNHSGIVAVTNRLPSERGIYCAADAFDADANLLGTGDGVVDLRTGEVVPNHPDLLISKFAKGRYRPGAELSGLAKDYIEGIYWSLPRDVADFLQLLVGASIFGEVKLKMFMYLWGVTDAGKSSIIDPLMHALGDYATTGSESIVAGKQAQRSEHSEHMLPMANSRIVIIPEVDSTMTLLGSRIKDLTGGDSMNMRAIHGKARMRRLQAALWLTGNPQSPRFDASDQALINRLMVIPFYRARTGEDKDINKLAMLRHDPEVHDAALTWAIEGAIKFHANPSQVTHEPAAVIEGRAAYVEQHDDLGTWLANCTLKTDKPEGTHRATLLGALNNWERSQNIQERYLTTNRQFAGAMRARGYSEWKRDGYPFIDCTLTGPENF